MASTPVPRRVLLAGGGTAGHTSPLLATADALRRRDPDIEITALGTSRGLETRVVPEAGYPLELIPPVPVPRRPGVELLRTPGRLRGAMKAALEVLDRRAAGRGGRVRRLRLGAGVPRRPQAQAAARRPRGQRAPRYRQQARCPVHAVRRHQLPRHRPAARPLPRAADPPDDQHPRPGRAARRGTRDLRARPRPADPARDRWLAGGAPAQPVGRRGGSRLRRGRRPGAAHRRPAGRGEAGGPDRRSAVRRGAVRQPDGPRLRRRRRGRLPGREQHRHRGVRGRPPGDLRAAADRQRRAGPQRPPGDRRRRWPARGRRRPHARVGEPHGPGAAHRPGAAGGDVGRGRPT